MNLTKKDLVHKLHIQHRNDRHDAVDIVNEYFAEIRTENQVLWKKCTQDPNHIQQTYYDFNKRVPDVNEITRRLMNMKQRKPKDNE